MYYIIRDYEVVKVIDCPSREIAKAYCKRFDYDICYEVDGVVTPADESDEIHVFSDDEISTLQRLADVEKHNKAIYDRLYQLDEELPEMVTLSIPVQYVGLHGMIDSYFTREKIIIQDFQEQYDALIKAGYKQVGLSNQCYYFRSPDFEKTCEQQREERERLKAGLWE